MDENVNFSVGMAMVQKGNLDPSAVSEWGFVRSSFIFDFFALLSTIYYFLGRLLGLYISFSEVNPVVILLTGRVIIAILGTSSVYLTYKIASRMFNWKLGILAAFFLGTTFTHVLVSHYGTSDVPQGIFQLVSFYFMYKIVIGGQLKDYLLSGLFIGLAISSNYHAAWSIANLVIAHVLHIYPEKFSLKKITNKFIYLIVSLIFVPLGFLIFTPYALIEFRRFISDISFMKNMYQSGQNAIFASSLNGISTPLWWAIYLFISGLSPLYFILALAGIVISFFRQDKTKLLLISFPLVWFIAMGANTVRFDRHITPILPMLAILASLAFCFVTGTLSRKFKFTRKLTPLLLALVVSSAVIKIIPFDYLLAQKDTRLQAVEWARESLDKNTLIFTLGAAIPIGQRLQQLGFANVINSSPDRIGEMFSYPGEVIIIGEDGYRTAKSYRQYFPYSEFYKTYETIYNQATLIKKITSPLFEKEFFAPFFLEESSTVTIYHNPAISFYTIPKLDEFTKGFINFLYLPENMIHNIILKKNNGYPALYADGSQSVGIAGPHKPFQKGNYALGYFLDVISCDSNANQITIYVISSGGGKELARKTYLCSSAKKLSKLGLEFNLDKTYRLELVLRADPGIKMYVNKAQVNSINN